MSRQNVELIERMHGEARHNPAALYELLDDEVRWDVAAMAMPDTPSTYHGPEGVSDFIRRWVGASDEWGYQIAEVIEGGDSAFTQIHQYGRGKGSGATVEARFWQVWTLRGGKVARGTLHVDRTKALEAAGLRE
jgi:ketosteroid isomerase-like protein